MPDVDRLELLKGQLAFTGISHVEVQASQTELHVHFWTPPLSTAPPLSDLVPEQIRIRSVSPQTDLPEVGVLSIAWIALGSEDVLQILTETAGDFVPYVLDIDDDRVDPFYRAVEFSFKVDCPSELDCAPVDPTCTDEVVDFPVDYSARDFWSYRTALLDFAAQRYPEWTTRLEADQTMMLAELFAALGDQLAYVQDRMAREGALETASQRRSIRQLARLVDYPMHDGLAASGWLQVTVLRDVALAAGTSVWAESQAGERIAFEVGRGLQDALDGESWALRLDANGPFEAHIWDDSVDCVEAGATSVDLVGAHAGALLLDDVTDGEPAHRWMLLQTDPDDASIPARRHMVRVVDVDEIVDPLLGTTVTRITWEPDQALPWALRVVDLSVWGNAVPITAGEIVRVGDPAELPRFVVTDDGVHDVTIQRDGPDGAVLHRYTLPDPDGRELCWLGESPQTASPEIHLVDDDGREWTPKRSFVGASSSQASDRDYVIEDGTWGRIAGFQRGGQELVFTDYLGDHGSTIRFGDGVLGLPPDAGDAFTVTFRVGNGRRGNVPAESIRFFDHIDLESVRNPLATSGGQDRETFDSVRRFAPHAYKTVAYRAVRSEDYAECLERLDWVQQAGASMVWTGSWPVAMAAPDPRDAVSLSDSWRAEGQAQLERFRQAGRDAQLNDPRYVALDFEITLCAESWVHPGELRRTVDQALFGQGAFFDPDNFTFGDALIRSSLEAFLHDIHGVRAVEGIRIRRRGWFDWEDWVETEYAVEVDEILRVDNDRANPQWGTVSLEIQGGA